MKLAIREGASSISEKPVPNGGQISLYFLQIFPEKAAARASQALSRQDGVLSSGRLNHPVNRQE